MPENIEAITVFLSVSRQIRFDPGGHIAGPDLAAIAPYIDIVVKEDKEKVMNRVLLLMRKVAIPAYIEGVKE